MKFTIPKLAFVTVLTRCAAIAERKASMPILCCVLLEPLEHVLKISATDLETGYTTAIDGIGWGDYTAEGLLYKIATPAKKLLECVKAIPVEDIEIDIDRYATVTVSGGTASFTLGILNAEEFPNLPKIEGVQFQLPAPALVKVLNTVAYAQGKDAEKPHICGALLKLAVLDAECDELELIAVTTDGHRMAIADSEFEGKALDIPADLAKGIILPAKGVAELCKIKTPGVILFSLSGSSLCISTDNETIFLRLVEGDYPDYTRVIPQLTPVRIEVPRQPLIDALERCRIITDKDTRGVMLTTNITDGITLASDLPSICGHASDKVTAIVPEEPFSARVNVGYMLEALNSICTENVEISGKDELTPLILNPFGTESAMHIIMPMRIG